MKHGAINNKLPLRFAKKTQKAPQQFQKEETVCACAVTRPAVTPSLYPCIEPQGAEPIGSQQVVVWQVSYGNIMEISKLCKKWVGSWEGTDHFSFSPSRSRYVETLPQNFGVNASLESRFCISNLYC